MNISSEELMHTLPPLKYIRLSHSTIAYRENGSGPPLLFLHGMSGDSRIWAFQFLLLSKHYRVIAWDAPGFGGSEPCGTTKESYAHAGIELLKAIDAFPAAVVGHSMGGIVAVHMVKEESNAVGKLILSCTHLGYAYKEGKDLMSRYQKRIEELNTLSQEEYGALRAKKMLMENVPAEIFSFVTEVSGNARKEGIINAGRVLQEADNSSILPHIKKPILIIHTDLDPVVRSETTRKLISAASQAQVVELKGLGHAPYIEAPQRYNEVLQTFLEDQTG